jgi:hypothetical protein
LAIYSGLKDRLVQTGRKRENEKFKQKEKSMGSNKTYVQSSRATKCAVSREKSSTEKHK